MRHTDKNFKKKDKKFLKRVLTRIRSGVIMRLIKRFIIEQIEIIFEIKRFTLF